MKKMKWIAVLILSAGLMTSCANKEQKEVGAEGTTETVGEINTTHAYTCPMHCENSASMVSGLCSVCGMDLVKNPDYKPMVPDSTLNSAPDTANAGPRHTEHH